MRSSLPVAAVLATLAVPSAAAAADDGVPVGGATTTPLDATTATTPAPGASPRAIPTVPGSAAHADPAPAPTTTPVTPAAPAPAEPPQPVPAAPSPAPAAPAAPPADEATPPPASPPAGDPEGATAGAAAPPSHPEDGGTRSEARRERERDADRREAREDRRRDARSDERAAAREKRRRADTDTDADGAADAEAADDDGGTGARLAAPDRRLSKASLQNFRIPLFLLPVYQAAGTQYGVRWEVLAAINEVETDYGRNLTVSSAGARGWMQFMPATWRGYGVDANADGRADPYNPADAIFAAARYLKAAGAERDVRRAIFAYNHADWYVDEVMERADAIAALPTDVVGSLTGLSSGAQPPVADGDPRVRERGEREWAPITAAAGSRVAAVQDGTVTAKGKSERRGRWIELKDAYGNRYTYTHLGDLADEHLVPREEHDESDHPREHEGAEDAAADRSEPADAPAKTGAAAGPDAPARTGAPAAADDPVPDRAATAGRQRATPKRAAGGRRVAGTDASGTFVGGMGPQGQPAVATAPAAPAPTASTAPSPTAPAAPAPAAPAPAPATPTAPDSAPAPTVPAPPAAAAPAAGGASGADPGSAPAAPAPGTTAAPGTAASPRTPPSGSSQGPAEAPAPPAASDTAAPATGAIAGGDARTASADRSLDDGGWMWSDESLRRALGTTERATPAPVPMPADDRARGDLERFRVRSAGLRASDLRVSALHEGSRVTAGTVLGRTGSSAVRFAVRPAGKGAPRIDPRPIVDGWERLERTATADDDDRPVPARLATAGDDAAAADADAGSLLLLGKDQLQRRVLQNPRIEIYPGGRDDVRTGQIDRRVLAALEYLTADGTRLGVSSLRGNHGPMTSSGNVSAHSYGAAVDISSVDGTPIANHQGAGSVTEATVRRLLRLQGAAAPNQIISLMTVDGAPTTIAMDDHADHIHVGFPRTGADEDGTLGAQVAATMEPSQWPDLVDRLAEIDNPDVRADVSEAATEARETDEVSGPEAPRRR